MAQADPRFVTGDDDAPDCELIGRASPAMVRSPTYVVRLLVGAVAILVGLVIAVLYEDAAAGLAYNQRLLLDALPDVLQTLVSSLGVYALVAVVGAINWVLLSQRRFRTALTLNLAALAGAALSFAAERVVVAMSSSSTLDGFLAERLSGQSIPTISTSPILGATVAALVLGGPWLSARWRNAWWWTTVIYIAAVSVLSTSGFLGVLVDLGVGTVAGALIGIIFKTPNQDPSGASVVASLRRLGLLPVSLASTAPHPTSTPTSVRWEGTLEDGSDIAIKVRGPNRHAAELLSRLWRRLRLKAPRGERSVGTLRGEANHEALSSLQAHNLGVRTPRVLAFGSTGANGMMLVTEFVTATDLAEVDEHRFVGALEDAWAQLAALRRAGIAHRQFRVDNLMIDDDDHIWLVGFVGSEVAADDVQLTDDIVELLASTAAVVGPQAAVAAALKVLGRDPLVEALSRMQPLAATTVTRDALSQDGFKALRSEVAKRTSIEEVPDAEDLSRFSTRRILTISMIGGAAYFLVPQLASAGNLWDETQSANWWWAAVALLCSAVSYVGSGLALVGGVPNRVPILQAVLAQVAAAFSDTITPAKVGGMALNLRFLTKQGVDAAVAAAGIGMSVVAGFAVHILLVASFITAAGRSSGGRGRGLPSLTTVLGLVAVVLAVSGLVMATPWGRRVFLQNLIDALRRARDGVVGIATRPGKVASLFGGSAITTMANLVALYVSVLAFGGSASFVQVGVVYLTGAFVEAAAPTPGGLGASEAAYIAGLTAVGMTTAVAVPAVFLFRLATFWLPVAPGWAAITYMRNRDDL